MSSILCFRLLYISLYNVLTFVHYTMQAERGRSSYCGSSCWECLDEARQVSTFSSRWQMETWDTHVPPSLWGDGTTLQDVAMLLGLSITRDAVGPRVVPSTWLEDLVQRFAGVATTIDPEDFNEHPIVERPFQVMAPTVSGTISYKTMCWCILWLWNTSCVSYSQCLYFIAAGPVGSRCWWLQCD